MFKNYLYTALRFLKRNNVFTGINIFGLSIALAASFIIILFVINELSYNCCYKNRKQIFRILNYHNEFKVTQASTPFVLASALKEEFPEVEKAINTRELQGFSIKHKDDKINVLNAVATSSEVFDIFTLPLISGCKTSHLLDDKYSVCLSRKLAEKLFPELDVVGKEIVALINNKERILKITAVFENIPENSTLRADCLINCFWAIDQINKAFEITNVEKSWTHDFWTTWVLLNSFSNAGLPENKFRAFEIKHIGADFNRHYFLQNLSDVYLKSDNIINPGIKGSMANIMFFSTIAFLIVLVAAINYIILSTAVSSSRGKEIGIRKTYGASNSHIKYQFLIESILLTAIVLPIASVLMILSLPFASELFQTQLYILKSNIIQYVAGYLTLTLLIGVASGIYTSAWLSRLKVMHVLKTSILIGKKKHFFRSSLIVVQLIIFCFFVSCVLIIRSQYQLILKKNPGFYNQNILLIDIDDGKSYTVLLNEIRANPNVIMAAGTMLKLPTMGSMSVMLPHFQNKDQKLRIEQFSVDYDFLQTMGISVIEGRSFLKDFGSDLTNSCILNETAVKQLGITAPIGKEVGHYIIIGVVKDFNLHSFHTDIPPLMITLTDQYIEQIAVRYIPGSFNRLLPLLEKSWKKVSQEKPFRYSTIEGLINELYSKEKKLSLIVTIFAIFTLLIASFGLLGLTLFIAQSCTKEIGIRKVVGSSGASIIYSFIRMNILYVLVASTISIPITFVVMLNWLKNYSLRIEIKWWFFAITFVIASVVVVLTVLIHSYRAARRKPIEALRYE